MEGADDKWGDKFTHDLEIRLDKLNFNDQDVENDITRMKEDTIKLVANQIYDTMTKLY